MIYMESALQANIDIGMQNTFVVKFARIQIMKF